MVSHWGSEAGLDSWGRWRWGGLGLPGRRGFRVPGRTAGPPPWLHLARSFPGDSPCSSTSPRGQVRVRCELRREPPEPLSLAPPPRPALPFGAPAPTPRPYLPPPGQPRVPALEGRSDWLHRPSPGGLRATPSQRPGPLSALPSLLGGTLSLQDFQPSSSPHRESRTPQMPSQPGTEVPQPTPLLPSVCLSSFLSFPQPSSLPLPPDPSTPLSAFCFSLRLPLGF